MAQKLQDFSLQDGVNAIVAGIDRDGGVIVRDFIPLELHACLKADLEPYAQARAPGSLGNEFKQLALGKKTKRFTGLAAKSRAFADIIDHDLLHAWAKRTFRADYWLNTGQAIVIGPAEGSQALHRDYGSWPSAEALGPAGPEATISILLPITDFTEQTGATRVVPGSHKWEDYAKLPEESQVTQAVMSAGAALLYTGRVLHGGGENKSAGWRFGIHMSFVSAEFTPDEANCLTVPWTIAQTYSPRVQHMLGFYSLRSVHPSSVSLWQADAGEVRNTLSPKPAADYVPDLQEYSGDDFATTTEYFRRQIDGEKV